MDLKSAAFGPGPALYGHKAFSLFKTVFLDMLNTVAPIKTELNRDVKYG